MKVICISGKAQHGKDSTAGFMKDFLEFEGKKVLIAHYGDLVKYVCKTFFDWDGKKDEAGRTILQRVGTDVIREQDEMYWVRFIKTILKFFPDEWDYVLIPDCRFPNEIEYLDLWGFDVTHLRVVRENLESPLTEEQQRHPSETALDEYGQDILLINRGDLADLQYAVKELTYDILNDVETRMIATAQAGDDICELMKVCGVENADEEET